MNFRPSVAECGHHGLGVKAVLSHLEKGSSCIPRATNPCEVRDPAQGNGRVQKLEESQ